MTRSQAFLNPRSRKHMFPQLFVCIWVVCALIALPLAHPHTPAQGLQTSDPTTALSNFTLTIDQLKPRVLTNEKEVRIEGSLKSPTDLKDVELSLYVRGDSFYAVPHAQMYLEGDSYPGVYVTSSSAGDLKAGKAKTFSLTVPADQLPLRADFDWGPRGIEVLAQAGEETTSDRSILLWDSGYEVEATRLSIVSSITEGVSGDSKEVVTTLPSVTQSNIATQLYGIDGVTLALGAGLLESGTFAKALAKAGDAPIISLPAADADVAGIAHLKTQSEFAQLVKDSKAARNLPKAKAAGLEVLDYFVWPHMTQLDLATVQRWRDQTIITNGTGLGPLETLTYDPSSWKRYDPSTGESVPNDEDGVDVLVGYEKLHELLSQPSETIAEELDTQQMIRATTAIITRQLPNLPRTIVAVTKRNPDDENLVERVRAALDERWVEPISVKDAIDVDTESVAREALPQRVETPGSITDEETHQLYEAIESTAAMTSALQDSTGIVSRQRSRVLLASALALRERPTLRRDLIYGVVEDAQTLATSVKVEQSAPINVLDKSARLPVRITSSFAEPVTAVVELVPSDPRLQVEKAVEVQIPASGATIAEVPVRAIGFGDVTITVIVKGPNGLVIDDDTQLHVRVRAEWENKGLAIISVLLVLLLVVGILRTIRKGRRIDPKRRPKSVEHRPLSSNTMTKPGETDSTLREAGDPALREAQDPTRREAQDPTLREAGDPALREAQDPTRREAQDPALREAQDPALREAQDPTPRETQDPALREAQDPTPREARDQTERQNGTEVDYSIGDKPGEDA